MAPFEARLEGDGWSLKPLSLAAEDRIKALLADEVPVAEIAKETGLSKSWVYRVKKRLEEAR